MTDYERDYQQGRREGLVDAQSIVCEMAVQRRGPEAAALYAAAEAISAAYRKARAEAIGSIEVC